VSAPAIERRGRRAINVRDRAYERAMGQPAFFDLDRRLEAINAKGDA
jgi:hypothetical protein